MTGKLTNQPLADPQVAQPPKNKKGRSKTKPVSSFSAQASQRIEDLFSDLDQEPAPAIDDLAIETQPIDAATAQVIPPETVSQPGLPGKQPISPSPSVAIWQDIARPVEEKPPIARHAGSKQTVGDEPMLATGRSLPFAETGVAPDTHLATMEVRKLAASLQEPALLLEILDEDPQRRWSEDDLLLIEQVTDQLTLALENAQLFEQTQNARDALQISVRYQKSVAQAVADLTERGFTAISDVLRLLGEAAQCSRAYYMEAQIDFRGPYWRQIAEWHAPDAPSQMNNPFLRRISARWLPSWIERLSKEGYIATLANQLPTEERELLTAVGSRSLLQFPVAGQHGAAGCIGFEQIDYEREWNSDEIAALRTAAAALANTIVRENLFNQLQVNLSETEAQYQASAQINSADSYEEILTILRQFSILGHINAGYVSINLFDRPWTRTLKPERLIPVSFWASKAASFDPSEAIPLGNLKTTEAMFNPDRPTVVFDLASDPRLDNDARALYSEKMGAKSLINAPLNVSGRWIGQIIGLYSQTTGFTDREIRRLVSLAGQSAVAVESLRLLEETRQRNEELLAMNEITSSVSRTLELQQVLGEILQRVIAIMEYESGLISIAEPGTHNPRLAVQYNLSEAIVKSMTERGLAGTTCDLVYQTGQTISAPDLLDPPKDLEDFAPLLPKSWPHMGVLPAFEGPRSMGFRSYLGVPLSSKGIQLGTICLFNRTVRATSAARISLLEAIGQQVGVAVENARLFQSTQSALGETEQLYQASSELNAVKTFDDILNPLRSFTILAKADKFVSLFLFGSLHNQKEEQTGQKPEWITPAAQWSDLPTENLSQKYPLELFEEGGILSPLTPSIIEDTAMDERLDAQLKEFLQVKCRARGVVCAPLNVGGAWIGFVLGIYGQPLQVDETDIRRLSALSNQAAIAAQNLNSLSLAEQRAREAQRRSQELALINNIVTAVTGSLNLQQGLDIVSHELARAVKSFAAIALLNPSKQSLTIVSNARAGIDAPATIGLEIPLDGNPPYREAIETRRSQLVSRPPTTRHTGPLHDILRRSGANRLLIIPLLGGAEAIGTIELAIQEEREFNEDEIRLAESIVLQAATAIQNTRLFEQTQAVLQETEALYQASANLQTANSYSDILNTLRAYSALGKQPCTVDLVIYERQSSLRRYSGQLGLSTRNTLIAHWEAAEQSLGQLEDRVNFSELPIIGDTGLLQYNTVLTIEDVLNDARLDDRMKAMFSQIYRVRSAIFAPLTASGQRIGHASAFFESPTKFSEEEIRRLAVLAGQAAVAIQNLRLLDESRRRASQLQTAAEIARDTSGTLALDTLLQRCVNLILARFGYYHASIFLLDESGQNAIIRESTGPAGEEMERRRHHLMVGGQSVIGQVTQTGKPLVLNDVTADEARGVHRLNPLLPQTRAELGIPLKIGDLVIGALDVQSDQANIFTEDDISVLQILADQITVAMDNARSYEIAQKAMEEIREADRLKSQFLANMSHELRTPLNSIIGFSRVILKGIDGPITEQQSQDLNAIYSSGQHLLGLINDVLDVSRIEAGKMDLAFEENVNLTEIIRGVMSTTVGLVKDKPIELKQRVQPDLPLVNIDAMKIRQVLINLLSNAAKFTEEGNITIEAFGSQSPSGEAQVTVQVRDTGPGIAPEDRAKLFQPFSQVDGSLTRKTGGSGLGLSICEHLIRLHHGTIGLESEVGKGSVFFFIIPVRQPIANGQQPTADSQQPVIEPASQPVIYLGPSQVVAAGLPALQPVDVEATHSPESRQLVETPANLSEQEKPPEPAQPAPASAAPEFAFQPPGTTDLIPDRHALILAIDPDPQVIARYRRYLASQNFSIIAIPDLREAVRVARDAQPFAITLDVAIGTKTSAAPRVRGRLPQVESEPMGVPNLNGWQVLEALKNDPLTRDIPVIVCTVQAEEERGFQMGAVDYLLKPILEEELLQAVQRIRIRKTMGRLK